MYRLTLVSLFLLFPLIFLRVANAGDEDVRMSALGYLPEESKIASITGRGEQFFLKRASDQAVVFEGTLSETNGDEDTLHKVFAMYADFSAVSVPGIYYLEVPGLGRGPDFPIAEDVYLAPFKTAMLGFYGWRSGVEVSFEHGGQAFYHAAGHLQDGLLDYILDWVEGAPGDFLDGTGGWYDAGDYGKYTPNGAFSAGVMMAAFEDFGDRMVDVALQIPENGNDLPDFLDEVRFQMDWLLKMQLSDGSVSHKLTSLKHAMTVLPAEDDPSRYFVSPSTFATASFAAAAAQASRVFRPYDETFADACLDAALAAYAYLQANPDNILADLSGFSTGPYQADSPDGDGHSRIWADAEIFETTGDPAALSAFESRAAETDKLVQEQVAWSDQKMLGVLTYLRSERPERDPLLLEEMQNKIVNVAGGVVATSRSRSAFGRGFNQEWWGSNGVVAGLCMVLETANRIAPDPVLRDACGWQIHHLYGRNYYGRSQVTGEGRFPPCHPHDRRSEADAVTRPYPGLLVGGGGHQNSEWIDEYESFETNEVAINWNSPLVYALASRLPATDGPSAVGFVAYVDNCTADPPDPPLPVGADVDGPEFLIDDFEDGDDAILEVDGRHGNWTVFDDGSGGINSGVNLSTSCREGSTYCVSVSASGYTLTGGGIGCRLNDDGTDTGTYDGSVYSGISFWAKSAQENTFKVRVVDGETARNSDAEFTVGTEWTKFVFAWEQLNGNVDDTRLFSVQFLWGKDGVYDLMLDDIAFASPYGYVETPLGSDAGVDGGGDRDLHVEMSGGGCSCVAVGRPGSTRRGWIASIIDLFV